MIFLAAFWAKFQVYIIGAVALVGLLGGVYLYAQSTQRSDTRAKQAEQRLEDIKKSKEIRDEVYKLPEPDLDLRLDKWMRD